VEHEPGSHVGGTVDTVLDAGRVAGGNHQADAVADALSAAITTLPSQLAKSLTWEQGYEMAQHQRFSIDTGVQVYFCDPKSPWQRGSNENTYWCRISRAGLL
jgi:IS30 family transposase